MLNLYAVTVWRTQDHGRCETVEVRTYSAKRAEHLATESYPGCQAVAALIAEARKEPTLPPAPSRHVSVG
jgi:hypothetical protein